MAADDLALVLAWRNHPAVRASMLRQHEITAEEHQRWFDRAAHDPTRKLLLAHDADAPIGFVHFSNVAEGGVADWGFYAAPDAPRGSGTKLGAAALDLAFGELQLHKVCGQALAFNAPSVRLHAKLGFSREGVLREQHRIGEHHHDLVCFGILQREWT
jgi:UDP-4-amino-4,6-dideoxy-N-acetyl-beta-L-altrosamine N-acetyltransferase